ncbi:MAG: HAD family hydrolase, partial [Planctomycetota bacterium]
AESWPEQATDSETIARWDDQKEAAFRAILHETFPAMDGAEQLIERLDEAGFRLAVGSSGPRENVQAAMENLPGASRFAAVVTGNDVSRGKPHPEVFLKAAERLGVHPGRCAVVEDAVAGLQAATAAGMVAIGLTGTTQRQALDSQADMVVESLHDLSVDGLSRWIEQNARQEGCI